jgi:hypothetical protein
MDVTSGLPRFRFRLLALSVAIVVAAGLAGWAIGRVAVPVIAHWYIASLGR